MLLEQPQLDSKKQMKCLNTWARLGPLTLQEIINSTIVPVDFKEDYYEYQEKRLKNGQIIQGQFSKFNFKLNGVARIVYPNNVIYEGQTKDDMPEGFGRVLDASGEYYIGQYRDTLRHGQGKFVTADGEVHEGNWFEDEFKKNE